MPGSVVIQVVSPSSTRCRACSTWPLGDRTRASRDVRGAEPGRCCVVIECSQRQPVGPGDGDDRTVATGRRPPAPPRAAAARASGRRSAPRPPASTPSPATAPGARTSGGRGTRAASTAQVLGLGGDVAVMSGHCVLLGTAASRTSRGSPCGSRQASKPWAARTFPANSAAVADGASATRPAAEADQVDVGRVVGQVVGRRPVVQVGVRDDARAPRERRGRGRSSTAATRRHRPRRPSRRPRRGSRARGTRGRRRCAGAAASAACPVPAVPHPGRSRRACATRLAAPRRGSAAPDRRRPCPSPTSAATRRGRRAG